jgi:Ca2+-binding EF-hand superfamily protein
MEHMVKQNHIDSVSEEEIEEMIRLCDIEGDKKVYLKDFINMAKNNTINSVGQNSFPTNY